MDFSSIISIISIVVGFIISIISWLIKDKIKVINDKIDTICLDLKTEGERARNIEGKIFDKIDNLSNTYLTQAVFNNEKENNWRNHSEIQTDIDALKRKVYNGGSK